MSARNGARLLTMRDKGFWRRLTKTERARLMQLQMSKSWGYGGGGYLPDDCSECGACGQPMLGVGLCSACYREYAALVAKGAGSEGPARDFAAAPPAPGFVREERDEVPAARGEAD